MPPAVMDIIVTNYGPVGFGLVALLILWKFIVAPELKQSRDAISSISTATEAAKDAAMSSRIATQSAAEAAHRCEHAARQMIEHTGIYKPRPG